MSIITKVMYSTVSIYVEYFIGFLISILIARSLGPTDYGQYTFVIWVCALMIMFMNGGITTAIIKFLAEERGKNTDEMDDLSCTRNIFLYLRKIHNIKSVVLLLMIIVAGSYYWQDIFFNLNVYLFVPLVFAIYFKASHMFYISAAKGMEKFDLIAKLVVIVSPVNLLLVIMVYSFNYGLEVFIILYSAVSFLYYIMARFLLVGNYEGLNRPLINDTKQRINNHLKVVTVNVILAFIIFKQSEIGFLNVMSSKESVAYYNIGFTLSAAALLLVPGVYSALLLPIMSRIGAYDNNKLSDVFVSATRYLFFLTIPIVFLGILYAEFIIILFYGQDYREAVFPLQILILSGAIFSVATAAQSFHMSSDLQKTIFYYLIVTAFINMVLDYFLIKYFGLNGALFANLIATLVISVLLMYNAIKLTITTLHFTVFVKMLISGMLAFLIPFAIDYFFSSSIFSLAIGTILFSFSYLLITIVLQCWTKSDLEAFIFILQNVLSNRFPYFTKMLSNMVTAHQYYK